MKKFKESIRGELITAEDASYDEQRSVYNGMIDRYPALIVKCRDVTDVIAAVNFGRDQKVLVASRGGGHNAGGLEEFHLKKMCALLWCNVGDHKGGARAVQVFRDLRKPDLDYAGPKINYPLNSLNYGNSSEHEDGDPLRTAGR